MYLQLDMKRHSLKVVNAICWVVLKCDNFDNIKADLLALGERHRNYGLKLCYIQVSIEVEHNRCIVYSTSAS